MQVEIHGGRPAAATRDVLDAVGCSTHHRRHQRWLVIPVCPTCDQALMIVHLREVEVDVCPQCHGLWLDEGELEQLLETPSTPAGTGDLLDQLDARPGPLPADRHLCPRCDRPLQEVAIPGRSGTNLTLDTCGRQHGWWFDANELTTLLGLNPDHPGARQVIAALQELSGSGRGTQPASGGSPSCP
ncbi:zf-TFIIB domain-containing protein [bacterium]|nr:zf-TFIIB domain-containing protein [bacterium]